MFSWRTCVHETSHALCARALGVAVTHAIVNPDGSGATKLDWRFDDGDLEWRTPLCITLAGVVGERLLVGPADYDNHEIVRARGWIEGIRGMAAGSLYCVAEHQPEFITAVARADRLLRRESSVVTQLARRLEQSGFMTGAQIERISASRDPSVLRDRLNLREQNLLRC